MGRETDPNIRSEEEYNNLTSDELNIKNECMPVPGFMTKRGYLHIFQDKSNQDWNYYSHRELQEVGHKFPDASIALRTTVDELFDKVEYLGTILEIVQSQLDYSSSGETSSLAEEMIDTSSKPSEIICSQTGK